MTTAQKEQEPRFRATVILADYAAEQGGKLNLIGGFWDFIKLGLPMGLAWRVQVELSQLSRRHKFRLILLHGDGSPFSLPMVSIPMGETKLTPLEIMGEFEPNLNPGNPPPGRYVAFCQAVNISPLPLKPGDTYKWKLFVDDTSEDDWEAPFVVMS